MESLSWCSPAIPSIPNSNPSDRDSGNRSLAGDFSGVHSLSVINHVVHAWRSTEPQTGGDVHPRVVADIPPFNDWDYPPHHRMWMPPSWLRKEDDSLGTFSTGTPLRSPVEGQSKLRAFVFTFLIKACTPEVRHECVQTSRILS